jgi:hypothetical protein
LMMPISKDDLFVNTKLKILTPMHELNLQCTDQILRTHCNIVELLKSFGHSYQRKNELHTVNYGTINIHSVN